MNRSIEGTPLDEGAIAFLRHWCAGGCDVACAFGKDSIVVLDLVRRSGVPHTVHHCHTTVDAPELVYLGRKHYPDVARIYPKHSFWWLIEKKGMLPTIHKRFCCRELKEGHGGDPTVTGIRAQESTARACRSPVERQKTGRGAGKKLVHPLLHWRHEDVWCYIRERGLPYPSLYDEGFHRLGCVVCPYNSQIRRSVERWPKMFAAARRAIRRAWDRGIPTEFAKSRFDSADDYVDWWIRHVADHEPFPGDQTEAPLFDAPGTCEGLFT